MPSSPALSERVDHFVRNYNFALEDYGVDGQVTEAAFRRMVTETYEFFTDEEREELAMRQLVRLAEVNLEACARIGALEKFVDSNGETQYRKLRDLTQAENEMIDALVDEEMSRGYCSVAL